MTIDLDFFLGVQNLTHIVRGNDGVLGLDGQLYRFVQSRRTDLASCPQRGQLERARAGRSYGYGGSTGSHYCVSTALGEIRLLDQDELEQIKLVIELRSVDRMVTFHRRPSEALGRNMIYAVDESWGTETSDKVLCEIGTRQLDEHHQEFAFYFNPDGYTPSWMKARELAQAALDAKTDQP